MGITRFGTSSPAANPAVEVTGRPGWLGLIDRLFHFWCGLRGHEPLLQIDQNRMYLHCASCGYETSGWDVGPHSRRRARRTPTRYAHQPQFVGARKVA